MNKMDDDGTRLLYHILKVTMSTTAAASKVALEQLIELSLKDHGWDINKMHTTFDQLIATLIDGQRTYESVIAFFLLLASKSLTISQFSSNELLHQRQYM